MNVDSGDIKLLMTENGIDINVENGFIEMTGFFDSAIILSLFGGNQEDNGTTGNKKTWWGNLIEENNPERKYISHTLNIIQGLPATPSNLKLLTEAVNQDLKWFIDEKIADKINVLNTLPEKNRVNINIDLMKDGKKIFSGKYTNNWLALSA